MPKKSPLDRSEYEEQKAIFEWAKRNEKKHPELKLLFGSLMGVNVSKAQAGMAKIAGVKAGKPDIHLPVAKNGFCGLWIELKRKDGGRVSIEQDEMLRLLAAYQNAAFVCHGADAAIMVIEKYLSKNKSSAEKHDDYHDGINKQIGV
jgi:hypothetical protein